MWDVMEKDVSYGTKSGGELQCVEKVDVKVTNIDDSEVDMLATMIDNMNHRYLQEQIICVDTGRKDFVLTVGNCELALLKEALRALLQVVSPERITLDT